MKERSRIRTSKVRLLPSHPRARLSPPLVQVHPVPSTRHEVLAIVRHLLRRYAAAHRKPVPGLSEDAAAFLASRRWSLRTLTARVAHAVAANQGNLVTADDLSD